MLEKAIEDGALSGEGISGTDPKLISAFLNALVEKSALHHLRTGKPATDLLDRAIQALFDSLASGGAQPRQTAG